jgi:hypothetical protein
MGREWQGGLPWNWDLWNTPLEPDDDDATPELYNQKLDAALEAGRESDKNPQASHDTEETGHVKEKHENQVEEDLSGI